MVGLCAPLGADRDPGLDAGHGAKRGGQDAHVRVVAEVTDPGADGFGEDVCPVSGGHVELGDDGCGVDGVPVPRTDRVEGDAQSYLGGESS